MSLNQLLEYTFADIKKKQLGVTDLFPTFHDRVRQVAAKGGVRLKERLPNIWHFKVASAQSDDKETGKKYDVYIQFNNIYPLIKKWAANTDIWKKDGSGVDHRKLADAIFSEVDMETSCSCPATLFWGPDYIRTQRLAQYGDQEERPPRIRNPREKGILCKHGDLVFDVLPAYKSTFAKHLMQFYKKAIETVEKQIRDGDVPPEYPSTPIEPIGPKPKRPSRGGRRKAPPVSPKPAAKTKKEPTGSEPGGSRSATGKASSSAEEPATIKNGSATKKAG